MCTFAEEMAREVSKVSRGWEEGPPHEAIITLSLCSEGAGPKYYHHFVFHYKETHIDGTCALYSNFTQLTYHTWR
jgi:hypothetical protein